MRLATQSMCHESKMNPRFPRDWAMCHSLNCVAVLYIKIQNLSESKDKFEEAGHAEKK